MEKQTKSLQPELFAEPHPPDELSNSEFYIEQHIFTGIRASDTVKLKDMTYNRCTFKNSIFNKTNFTDVTFQDCEFQNSELLLCHIDGTTFDNVLFKSCKLTGINFTESATFGFAPDFIECLLDSCIFYANTLSNQHFTETTIRNTDFSNCMMKTTEFSNTRFQSCSFLGCNLEKADFRTASGYVIDPSANKLKGARFSLPEAASFLHYLGITVE
jgi:fluoroquinolone resistance protein